MYFTASFTLPVRSELVSKCNFSGNIELMTSRFLSILYLRFHRCNPALTECQSSRGIPLEAVSARTSDALASRGHWQIFGIVSWIGVFGPNITTTGVAKKVGWSQAYRMLNQGMLNGNPRGPAMVRRFPNGHSKPWSSLDSLRGKGDFTLPVQFSNRFWLFGCPEIPFSSF